MIKTAMRKLGDLTTSPVAVPLFLLLLALVSYAVLFRSLGFYWDEWPYTWIAQKLGPAGLARYFATNRPVWGLIYRLTTALIAPVPWYWQLFGLFWRWASAVAVWQLVRLTWPRQQTIAVWTSALFLLYPGFDQQPIAMMFGHFFIVLTSLLVSLCLMLMASRSKGKYWLYTLPALLFSLLNLLSMEYFFLLDLIRPLLLWFSYDQDLPDLRKRLRRVMATWLPYLAVLVVAIIWRTVIFKYQTQNYQPQLLTNLQASPWLTFTRLAWTALLDLATVTVTAWGEAFKLPNPASFGLRSLAIYWILVLVAATVTILFLWRQNNKEKDDRWQPQALAVAIFSMLLAGGPFWVTGLSIAPNYPLSRFTLPFMFGSSLFLATLLAMLPRKRAIPAILLGVLVGLSAGSHFQEANEFRRDWNTQKAIFWQMAWRIPGIQPGTALLTNDLPTRFTSDNSLSAPLNYIYAPDNRSENMAYMLYFASIRTQNYFKDYKTGQPINHNYLAAVFHGNTSQVVAIYFEPPGCLRVLDPLIEKDNIMLPEAIKSGAALSSTTPILPADQTSPHTPPVEIFGPEPAHSWCYFFEKADLARQEKDWQEVANLGNEAFNLNDHPNDPLERFPFIEGYAHAGQWQRALELSQESLDVTDLVKPPLCALWQRIDTDTPTSPEKDAAFKSAKIFGCGL